MFFNINDYVWLKLTEIGHSIYLEYWAEVLPNYEERPTLHMVNGYSRLLLWEAMEIFGQHMHIGGNLPFETKVWFGMDPPNELEGKVTVESLIR